MRKTHLLALTLLTLCRPAAAQDNLPPITLELDGYMRWYGTFADFFKKTDMPHLASGNVNKFDIMGDAEIYFQGSTALENGLKIGVMVQIKAGTEEKTFDESYLFAQGSFGQAQIGNVKNVNYQMAVTAPTVSLMGVQESSYNRFGLFGLLGKSAEATYATWDDISTKLNYISPTASGLTVGLSLMPSNKSGGGDNSVLVGNAVFQYGFSIAGLYEKRLNDDWLIIAGAGYAHYKPRDSFAGTHKPIRDFSAGIRAEYKNFSFGGSFKRELSPYNTASADGNFSNAQGRVWDAGVSYDNNLYGVSLTYTGAQTRDTALDSRKNTSDLIVAATKYRLGAGVSVFLDMSYAKVDFASGAKAQGVGSAAGFDVVF